MTLTVSLVAITPASFRDTAEALGLAMGHSGQEFAIPLTTGSGVTHYGLHAWITPEAAEIWSGQAYPTGTDYTPEQIDAVRSQLIISLRDEAPVPLEHWGEVLGANGLQSPEAE